MAKITIKTVDSSSASGSSDNSVIAYVPGYAIQGPVNTPTLCSSVAEFKKTFGSKAYEFKSAQHYDKSATSEIVANAHELDNSYFYALELLQNGMAVMFERIVDEENITSASTELKFNKHVRVATPVLSDVAYYAVSETKTGGWTIYSDAEYSSQASGVEFASENLVEGTMKIKNSTSLVESDEAMITVQALSSELDTKVTIKAKYPGEYGESIKVSILEYTDELEYPRDSERLFELYIQDTRYIVSFDTNSEYYIKNKLESDEDVLVDVSELDQDIIATDLYGIINKENESLTLVSNGEDEMTFAAIREILADSEKSPYLKLADKTVYDVTFITSGIYASMDGTDATIAERMLTCAATRGDATAVIDMKKGVDKNSYFNLVDNYFTTSYVNGEDRNNYGTIIAPAVKVTLTSKGTSEWMPASFAYLYALASSVKNNPIWLAVSGVTRGAINNLKEVEFVVDEGLADTWQAETKISINPIQNVRPYGYCIYGNRTLNRNVEGLTDSSFTNVLLLVNEAKKVTRKAITKLMFESNDSVLWNSFKALIEPTLEKMKSNRGLSDYSIKRLQSTKKGTVAGTIKLMPIEAVEAFEITFSLEDGNVTVE